MKALQRAMVADNVSIPAPMMTDAVPQRTFLMLRAEPELVKPIMEVVITCVVNTGAKRRHGFDGKSTSKIEEIALEFKSWKESASIYSRNQLSITIF